MRAKEVMKEVKSQGVFYEVFVFTWICKGLEALTKDTRWETTYPHYDTSGRCITYNPPDMSKAGSWHGIMVGLSLPNHLNKDLLTQVSKFNIYIHQKGKAEII